jgi:hypothetical protein
VNAKTDPAPLSNGTPLHVVVAGWGPFGTIVSAVLPIGGQSGQQDHLWKLSNSFNTRTSNAMSATKSLTRLLSRRSLLSRFLRN